MVLFCVFFRRDDCFRRTFRGRLHAWRTLALWARCRCASGRGVDRAGPPLGLQLTLCFGRNSAAGGILGLVGVIVLGGDLRPRNSPNQDQANHNECGVHNYTFYRYENARRQSGDSRIVPVWIQLCRPLAALHWRAGAFCATSSSPSRSYQQPLRLY